MLCCCLIVLSELTEESLPSTIKEKIADKQLDTRYGEARQI